MFGVMYNFGWHGNMYMTMLAFWVYGMAVLGIWLLLPRKWRMRRPGPSKPAGENEQT